MGTAWIFAAYAQPHRDQLKGLTPQLCQQYLEYLLGEHVMGLKSVGASGVFSAGIPAGMSAVATEVSVACSAGSDKVLC